MINEAAIEDAIAEYQKGQRAPVYTGSLAMSGWYALFPDEDGCMNTVFKWPAKFPNTGTRMVYLIFDSELSLLYVGMTTLTHPTRTRLGDYFGYVSGRGSGCLIKPMTPPWKARPYYVRTIPLSPNEAPVLEAYLIQKLNPPENSRR